MQAKMHARHKVCFKVNRKVCTWRQVDLSRLDRRRDARHEAKGGERRELRRVDDDGAAGEEGRRDLPGEDEEGKVPGADADRHPDRRVVDVDRLAGVLCKCVD